MRITTIAGVEAIIGIDWIQLPDSAQEKARQKKVHIKALGATHALTLEAGSRAAFGVIDSIGEKISPKAVSGLAWLAKALGPQRSVVIIKELDGDLVWVGALYMGLPVSRGDRVVKRDILLDVLDDLMIIHQKSEFEFVLDERHPGNLAEFFEGYAPYQQTEIKALLKNIGPVGCRLIRTRTLASLIIPVVLILLLAAGGVGYWQYQLYQQRLEEERRLKNPPLPPDQVYANSFSTYFSTKTPYPANQFRSYMYNEIRSLETRQSGWVFSTFDCEAGKRECAIEFKREPFSGELLLKPEKFIRIEQGMNAIKATMRIELPPQTMPASPRPLSLLELFPSNVEVDNLLPLFRNLNDLGNQFGFTTSFDAPKPISTVNAPGSPIEVTEGKWSIQGPLSMFDLLDKLPKNVFLDKARIEAAPDGTTMFSASGFYWSANQKGGVQGAQIPNAKVAAPVPQPKQ